MAIKSSDWRNQRRELMARKWAVKPHEAEVVCVCESNRFESWGKQLSTQSDRYFTTSDSPSDKRRRHVSSSFLYTLQHSQYRVTLLSYFSIL